MDSSIPLHPLYRLPEPSHQSSSAPHSTLSGHFSVVTDVPREGVSPRSVPADPYPLSASWDFVPTRGVPGPYPISGHDAGFEWNAVGHYHVESGPTSSFGQPEMRSYGAPHLSPAVSETYLDADAAFAGSSKPLTKAQVKKAQSAARAATRKPAAKKPEGYVGRPANAWILYRSFQIKRLKENSPLKSPQSDISKQVALMWKDAAPEVRKEFEELAEVKKAEHQAMYPNYRFCPVRKDKPARTVRRDADEDDTSRASSARPRTVRQPSHSPASSSHGSPNSEFAYFDSSSVQSPTLSHHESLPPPLYHHPLSLPTHLSDSALNTLGAHEFQAPRTTHDEGAGIHPFLAAIESNNRQWNAPYDAPPPEQKWFPMHPLDDYPHSAPVGPTSHYSFGPGHLPSAPHSHANFAGPDDMSIPQWTGQLHQPNYMVAKNPYAQYALDGSVPPHEYPSSLELHGVQYGYEQVEQRQLFQIPTPQYGVYSR